jgi:hypothetical protein
MEEVVGSKCIVNKVIGQYFGHMEAESCPKSLLKMYQRWDQRLSKGKVGFDNAVSIRR